MPFDRCRNLAFDTAALGVGDQDHRLAAAAPRGTPACQIQAPPHPCQRVRQSVRLDQRAIAGMQPLEQRRVARLQMLCRRTEGMAADMRDEQARRGDMPPSQVAGAQAEVGLLAIALGEQVGPQWPDRIQAGAPDIHAEADAHRNVDRAPAVHPPRQGVDTHGGGEVRPGVALPLPGSG